MKFKKPSTPTRKDLQMLLMVALFVPFLGVGASYLMKNDEFLSDVAHTFQALLFLFLLAPLAYAIHKVKKCKTNSGSAMAYITVAVVASVEILYLFFSILAAKHDLPIKKPIEGLSMGQGSILLLGYGVIAACTILTLIFQYFWVYKPGTAGAARKFGDVDAVHEDGAQPAVS